MGPLGRVGFLRKVERCAGNAKMQVTVLSLRRAPQPRGLRSFQVLEAGLEKRLGKPIQVLPGHTLPTRGQDSKITNYLGAWGWAHGSASKAFAIQP